MKAIGSLLLTILIAVVAIWLVFKLLVGVLKLVGLVIVAGLLIAAFYAGRKLLRGNGGDS
jgi:hypothetical protein